MSVPTNCSSCGMTIYTNPPIREMQCEKCDENEALRKLVLNVQHRLLQAKFFYEKDDAFAVIYKVTEALDEIEKAEID